LEKKNSNTYATIVRAQKAHNGLRNGSPVARVSMARVSMGPHGRAEDS